MKIFVKGLNSCPMRKQNLEQYRSFLVASGHRLVNTPQEADAVLLWTCAFRGDLRDNSLQEIERYQNESGVRVIVAGCLPDIDPDLLRNKFEGDVIPWRLDDQRLKDIFGSDMDPEQFRTVFAEANICEDTVKFRHENPDTDATFHDQFVKLLVSEGCRFDCSYCSEKLAFPTYRSFQPEELVDSCRRTVDMTGRREVILMADSLGDYGCDIGYTLPELIRILADEIPGVRLALGNLNPASFLQYFDEMQELLYNGHIRHLNLPLQSASDRILKLMNRPYTKHDMGRLFGMLNDVSFTEFDTHLIIGFPSETDADFEETMAFVLQYRPKYILANNYMESQGMASAKIQPKIPAEIRQLRLREFDRRMKQAGILCNTDDSELSADRLRRLNLVG